MAFPQYPPACNLLQFLGGALDGYYWWQWCPQNAFVKALCPVPGPPNVPALGDRFFTEVAVVKYALLGLS